MENAGYMPSDLYNLNSAYGTEDELKNCIDEMHAQDLLVLFNIDFYYFKIKAVN